MRSKNEINKRMVLFCLALILCIAFVRLAVKMTASTEDALILSAIFVAALLAFESWGESIGAARFQMQQKEGER